MTNIDIYDPAMCCSTGVCGPSVDRDLMRIATVINWLKDQGVIITRHGLTTEPQDFVANKSVSNALREEGADVLPITLVDGRVAKTGEYPTNEELSNWLNVPIAPSQPEPSCCDGVETVGT
jgi:hypothetical protein